MKIQLSELSEGPYTFVPGLFPRQESWLLRPIVGFGNDLLATPTELLSPYVLEHLETTPEEKARLVFEHRPDLSWCELASVALYWPETKEFLFKEFGFKSWSKWEGVLARFQELSDEFKTWLCEKRVEAKEIAIVEVLSAEQLKNLMQAWSELKTLPTRSEGIQWLDLAGECLLTGKKIAPGLGLSSLHALRWEDRPVKTSHPFENAKMDKLRVEEVRFGDKSGFQVRFMVSHPQDLDKCIAELQKSREAWSLNGSGGASQT